MAVVACTAKAKDDAGNKIDCPGHMVNGICTKVHEHMATRTGICSTGGHEGIRYLSWRGNPMPTCTSWKICGCECHDTYTEMFKLSQMPRQAVDNSGYIPDRGDYVMPTFEERIAAHQASIITPTDAPRVIESPAPAVVPATIARPFAPTPTGRSARGELEFWVKEACDIWLVEYPTPPQQQARPCTPPYVSGEIGRKYGIKPPSVGAVDAVWRRWEVLGFAVIGRKPTRFTAYTPEGIEHTLEGLKERAKRGRKVGAR